VANLDSSSNDGLPHPKHVQKKREDFQMMKELSAECVGTFMLVASVCGAALFSAPNVGFMAVAFSIGTAVLAMAYAVGPISGAHFNPAVTCGLVAADRFAAGKAVPYIIAQGCGPFAGPRDAAGRHPPAHPLPPRCWGIMGFLKNNPMQSVELILF
jgi:Major intrinsic protein